MQAKKRYLVLGLSIGLLLLLYHVMSPSPESDDAPVPLLERRDDSLFPSLHRSQQRGYVDTADSLFDADLHISARQRRATRVKSYSSKQCRMGTCFDFSHCQSAATFKVYVYPVEPAEKISPIYEEILQALRNSRYSTSNASEACLFVLSIDTLDRDKLSQNFVHDLGTKVTSLKLWNAGQNHIVFNMYAGTWPDYAEDDLGFDMGKAILAKASFSTSHYRPGFDISFPLFHKEHPFRGGEEGYIKSNNVPPTRPYTLVFKGKRYLTGIGSETRNSLYHIHNEQDFILLTTCRHGHGWQNVADERCEKDNFEYDRHDYKVLLHNSTFCLVPRGRRLGSFRYLETLQAGCIPVLLSNGWVLPFAEVIDWSKAAIWGDERLLLQVPSLVRSIGHDEILSLRQHTQFLWNAYFSSVEKIVDTTLEVMKERIFRLSARPVFVWNSLPGSLLMLPEYSPDLKRYPFYWRHLAASQPQKFTAVVYTRSKTVISSSLSSSSSPALYRLISNICKSSFLHRVIILCHCNTGSVSRDVRWPVPSHISVVVKIIKSIDSRFYPHKEIETDAVLGLDDDTMLTTDEVDFAFHAWKNFPDRIVGYPPRTHFWDDPRLRWGYVSKVTNDYSMVLTSAAFYHRYYGYVYTQLLPESLHSTVTELQNCEDILMNFVVSHATGRPPIKVGQRRQYKESVVSAPTPQSDSKVPEWLSSQHFHQRQHCMGVFVTAFGYMPLVRSSLRLDPLLFKDPVSIVRKKYRQMEHV